MLLAAVHVGCDGSNATQGAGVNDLVGVQGVDARSSFHCEHTSQGDKIGRIAIGKTRGIVLSNDGPKSDAQWKSTCKWIEEFERGLLGDLRLRGELFEMSADESPRRYSVAKYLGEERLVVLFCHAEARWDEVPVVSSGTPCRFLMHYRIGARQYLGPIRLLDDGGWEHSDLWKLR